MCARAATRQPGDGAADHIWCAYCRDGGASARTGSDECRQQRRGGHGYCTRDDRADGKAVTDEPPDSKKQSTGSSRSDHTYTATRSVARKLALQALYRWQLNDAPWQDLVQEFGEAEDMPRADREYFRT